MKNELVVIKTLVFDLITDIVSEYNQLQQIWIRDLTKELGSRLEQLTAATLMPEAAVRIVGDYQSVYPLVVMDNVVNLPHIWHVDENEDLSAEITRYEQQIRPLGYLRPEIRLHLERTICAERDILAWALARLEE